MEGVDDTEKMIEKNIAQQEEELEILKSIYGSDFQEEDLGTFSVMVHVGDEEGEEATLVVSFNLEYPTNSPPVYNLSVPWLSSDQKRIICNALDDIYVSNIGQPIVYFWVEKLRELLFEMKPEKLKPVVSKLIESSQTSAGSSPSLAPLDDEEYIYSRDTESKHSNKQEQDAIKNQHVPKIVTGEPLTDRKSTFQAHVATVHSIDDIKLVLEELYRNKKIKSATHNMYAYRIVRNDELQTCIQDCEDDGETHAGGRMLHLLQILDCSNVLVVVSRWYGGVLLYGDRFKHINNVARSLLEKEGYITKKGGR